MNNFDKYFDNCTHTFIKASYEMNVWNIDAGKKKRNFSSNMFQMPESSVNVYISNENE